VSNEVAQFNPEFMDRFVKVGKALGMKKPMPVIAHNGQKTAIVCIGKPLNFVGLMMPYRAEEPMKTVPTWLKAKESQNA
jgi:hypothetical protein